MLQIVALSSGNYWTITCVCSLESINLLQLPCLLLGQQRLDICSPRVFLNAGVRWGTVSPEDPHRQVLTHAATRFSNRKAHPGPNASSPHRPLCIWELVSCESSNLKTKLVSHTRAEKQGKCSSCLCFLFCVFNDLFLFSHFYLFVSSQLFILSLNQIASWIANSRRCFSALPEFLQQVINLWKQDL